MAQSFKIVFTQYKNCKRVMSSDFFFTEENFEAAFKKANTVLTGMKVSDPSSNYEIASIVGEGYSALCPKADHGFEINETEK